jgi:hypothetical protein
MARRVTVVLQDDVDGSEPARTVCFTLDGNDYEIDLTERNATALRDCLAPWIAAARLAVVARIPEPRSPLQRRSPDPVDIRRWAAENGIPVRARGRISVALHERYEAAH